MSKVRGGEKKQGVDDGPAGGGAAGACKIHVVTGPMRLLLHLLETRIGLFPADSGFDGRSRFRAPSLLTGEEPMPPSMGKIFADELKGLQRVGISPAHCDVSPIGAVKVFSLPFYYFDGFNAILYAEQNGKFFAAWKEQEMNPEKSPETILTPWSYGELLSRLREVLQVGSERVG